MQENVEKTSATWAISLGELCQRLQLNSDCFTTDPQFPLLIPSHWKDKFEIGQHKDPLLLQVLPRPEEFQTSEWPLDAVGDIHSSLCQGLIQKYRSRALLISTPTCQIHCRYCFRKHYPYEEGPKTDDQLGEALQLLSRHPVIHEVILSGGDPLTLPNRRLAKLCTQLEQLEQIDTLRIHSRTVTVNPSRTDIDLMEALSHFQGHKVLVTHVNHPNELDEATQASLKIWRENGWHLLNQSVLLKEVNDSVAVLKDLSRRLFSQGVLPYYLNLLDQVKGTEHFEVSQQDAILIHQELRTQLPGYLVPKMVKEIAGQPNKTLVLDHPV